MKTSACYNKQYKGHKNRFFDFRSVVILLLVVYPYLVGFAPDSTSASGTIIDLLIGFGRHSNVSYDCSGNAMGATNYSSVNYGASVTHNINTFEFGARAGGFSTEVSGHKSYNGYSYYPYQSKEENTAAFYLNPFLGAETEYFGLNVGAAFFSKGTYSQYTYERESSIGGNLEEYLIGEGKIHPTWVLRIGRREGFYFSTQYLSNVPIFSGGGIADAGFGFGSKESRNLTWIGTSLGPYQNVGLSLRQDIQLSDKIDFLLRGRAGVIEDNFEGGLSAGIRIDL